MKDEQSLSILYTVDSWVESKSLSKDTRENSLLLDWILRGECHILVSCQLSSCHTTCWDVRLDWGVQKDFCLIVTPF